MVSGGSQLSEVSGRSVMVFSESNNPTVGLLREENLS